MKLTPDNLDYQDARVPRRNPAMAVPQHLAQALEAKQKPKTSSTKAPRQKATRKLEQVG